MDRSVWDIVGSVYVMQGTAWGGQANPYPRNIIIHMTYYHCNPSIFLLTYSDSLRQENSNFNIRNYSNNKWKIGPGIGLAKDCMTQICKPLPGFNSGNTKRGGVGRKG